MATLTKHLLEPQFEALPRDRFNIAAMADLARVVALQTGDVADQEVAIRIYQAITRNGSVHALGPHTQLYAQLLMRARRTTDVERLIQSNQLPRDAIPALQADIMNPSINRSVVDTEAWLRALGAALSFPRTLELRAQFGPALDSLVAPNHPPVPSPYKISVITSSYNPGRDLYTAARSLIAQTWRNWEMLIVDDASPDVEPNILTNVAAMDTRIRVIRKAVNGGTYRARNTALSLIRGDFVTFLDSDDWVHPTYLETGVAPLLQQPSLIATRGWGARVAETLELTRPGYQTLMRCAPSLMFRAQVSLDTVGFFDPVRKAADTEYARRLEAAFGIPVHDTDPRALTLLRADQDSLSASDFSAGWRHPSRHEYKQYYSAWHNEIKAGSDPYLEPNGARRFPKPRRWSTEIADSLTHGPRYDVVFAGDWRRHGGPQNSMLAEISACLADGMRVGVLHIEAFRFMTRTDDPLCLPLRELLHDGRVGLVHIDDTASINTLVIRYPPVLQYAPHIESSVRPINAIMVANQAPCEPDGSDQRYVPEIVSENCRAIFNVDPLWVPQGPNVRSALAEVSPDLSVSDWDNHGIIDFDRWNVRKARSLDDHVVVGRYSRDHPMKFPGTTDELLRAYGFGNGYEVRMMGATNTVRRMLQRGIASAPTRLPINWKLYKHKAMDVREFLRNLDFFLYLDNPNNYEAFGRVILEAAASGVLTIVSPKHRDTFGDMVLYAEPDEAVPLVESLVNNPSAYSEQVARSRLRIAEHFSYQSFASRMRTFVTNVRSVGPGERASDLRSFTVDMSRPDSEVRVDAGRWSSLKIPLRSPADGQHRGMLVAIHSGSIPVDLVKHDCAQIITDIEAHGTLPRGLESELVRAAIYISNRHPRAYAPCGSVFSMTNPDRDIYDFTLSPERS